MPTELTTLRLGARLGEGATSRVHDAVLPDGTAAVVKIAREREHASILAHEAWVTSLAPSPRLPRLVAVGVYRCEGKRAAVDATGLPCIVLGRVEGAALRADGRHTLGQALSIARDVADALAALHELGLAHGDVKPANVLHDARAERHAAAATLIDLGLAGAADDTALRGGTPRYLGRGDRDLGDARARDLLALGLMLAELVCPEVARSERPLEVARTMRRDDALGAIITALLAPEPAARPEASWVVESAAEMAGQVASGGWQRRVSTSYLRARRRELARGDEAEDDSPAALHAALATLGTVRKLCHDCGVAPPASIGSGGSRLQATMDHEARQRWLVALVGETASSWPLSVVARVGDGELSAAMERLAAVRPPWAWTLADVEGALEGDLDAPAELESAALDVDRVTELSLALSRVPADPRAVRAVEKQRADVPLGLRLAAADALRLAGELGRARSLVMGIDSPVAAEIFRRSGDVEQAARVARRAMETGDPDGRALGCLARLAYDRGDLAEAARLSGDRPTSAPTCEVAALVAAARGDLDRALAHGERARALATSAEGRARAAGTLAYLLHGLDLERVAEANQEAVAHAVRAGAVLEEATYRMGEAACAVDLGRLDRAIEAARRSALLFEEVLRAPARAARAWLARAAAHAAVDDAAGVERVAVEAVARAEMAGDPRAAAYVWWAVADAHLIGDERGLAAARRGAIDLAGDDSIHAAARLHRHGDAIDVAAIDAQAAKASDYARLAWWSARAERALADGEAESAREVLAALSSLADARAPVSTLGKAMHAATQLAAALGDSDTLARTEAARRAAAAPVLASTRRGPLAEAARLASWLRQRDHGVIGADQAVDLQQLVRALSERESLESLLSRIVDVLLMWTGAERGLLLLRDASGALEPRAARNLGKRDLRGEQLELSTSLAQRALERGEPVVAIDAMEELSRSHDSVHALKLRSVMVLPLSARGEILGVAYLDDRVRRGAFGTRELRFAQAIAPVAALAIADAHTQEQLRRAVRRAENAQRRLEQALAKKESALHLAERELAQRVPQGRFPEIIGGGPAMDRVLSLVERIAPSDVPVLLQGESGSGKELVARAIHRASSRADRAFVGENCGALPETLLESALFGHVKGAFTGADRPRVGLFEAADGGTLFLDEVGEMSLGMQTKLLRVLEDSMVRPLGTTRARHVDVRIVAATNRDLSRMVTEGGFREDLFYRLHVVSLEIPPLRKRPEDVPLLVDHFIEKHAGRRVRVTAAARRRLERFNWPGNVRQLENEVRRALILAEDVIDVDHLTIPETAATAPADLGLDLRARIDRLEVELVEEALERTQGNQTRAAELLGVSRFGLHKMMKRLGMK